MKFVEVKDEDVPTRHRTTLKTIREFMESGLKLAKLDLEDPELKGRGINSIYVSMKMALKDGKYPVNVIQSRGEIYLRRTDKDGNVPQ
jgi:hypothetical protein